MSYENTAKTLVFNELCNWLIINYLGFRGKKHAFSRIFTILNNFFKIWHFGKSFLYLLLQVNITFHDDSVER